MTWPKSTPEVPRTIPPTDLANPLEPWNFSPPRFGAVSKEGADTRYGDGKSHRLNRSWRCSSSPKENREEKVERDNDISKKKAQISKRCPVVRPIGWKFGDRKL